MESSGTSFSAAFRAVAPFQEYLLQGSIMDAHCEVLLHRLRGLCDNADTTPETFNDYEAVYQLSKSRQICLNLSENIFGQIVRVGIQCKCKL